MYVRSRRIHETPASLTRAVGILSGDTEGPAPVECEGSTVPQNRSRRQWAAIPSARTPNRTGRTNTSHGNIRADRPSVEGAL
jgi:hypothetical protein